MRIQPLKIRILLESDPLKSRILVWRLAAHSSAAFLPQVASALQHLHGARVLHRDVKPANIFLAAAGRCSRAESP